MSKFEVRWEVEDGYVGKARPQSFKLDIEEMARSCDSEAEALTYIDDEVRQDFDNKISYYLKNQAEILEAWRSSPKSSGSES